MILSFFIVNSIPAQSKKDMEQKIFQMEEKVNNLESEIINIKTDLTNITTTLGLVSGNNLALEKLVRDQGVLIEELNKKNDSLLFLYEVNEDVDFISNPKNEEDSIIFLIQSYFACKKWEDRLIYVLKPETVKPYMQEYYNDSYINQKITKDKFSIQGEGYKTNESFKVIVGDKIVYCKKSVNGFKIDWEANTGFNKVSLKTFISSLSNTPTEFRVKAELGSSYFYNYHNAQSTHWNVNLSDINGEFIYAYILKSTNEGEELYEILKDGKKHDLILIIKIDSTTDKSGNVAMITHLVKEGWFNE